MSQKVSDEPIKIKLIEPIAVKWNEDKTSSLVFSEESLAPSGKYLMRGGITFPRVTSKGLTGFAIMAGRHIESGIIYIFNEVEFCTIDHVFSDDNSQVEFYGVGPWLISVWNKYFADTFFYKQDYDVARKFRTQIYRSKQIEPKPRFLESKKHDSDQSMHSIYELDMLSKLKYKKSSKVNEDIIAYNAVFNNKESTKADKESKDYVALHALKCVVDGFSRYS